MIGQKVSYLLPLKPGEVRARLERVVTPRRDWLFDFARYVSVRRERKPFYGQISEAKFRINHNEWTNEPWTPLIEGTIQPQESGTRVDATVGVSNWAVANLVPVTIAAVLLSSNTFDGHVPVRPLFVLWMVFVVCIIAVRTVKHVRDAKALFVRALGDAQAVAQD